jgi:ectoine hydroxylase-related dioxygenase (phytanoyl-CoA dioxygenase family)
MFPLNSSRQVNSMQSSPPRRADRIDASRSDFMTPQATSFFREQGYLILENALSGKEVSALHRDAADICRGEYGRFDGYLGPHDGQTDEQVLTQYLCMHYPHKFSPLMRRSLAHPAVVAALTQLIGPDVKCMQSMLFIKSSGKPGQAWHQDEDYIPTRDRSLTGGWIALDDATVDNGCLWVIPGSHRPGVLWPQARQSDRRFDCAEESTGFPYRDQDAVPVEVHAGSVVLFNGYLLHRSLPNTAPTGYRRVLVNHYMSASSLLPWTGNLQDHDCFLDHNRTVAKADVRDIVMVAGNDPYAWMGTRDVHQPHIRPSGEGGCGKSAATAGVRPQSS